MASAGSPPSAPDPNAVIRAQENANHYNANNPFGSASWTTGADGRDTMTQSMSPVMQQLMNQATGSALAPRQQMQTPEGMNQLASAILGRVGARYGLGTGNANNPTIPGQANFPHGGGGALNTNMAKGGASPPPTGGGPGGQMTPMDQLQLQANPGAQQGQMGGLGGLAGMGLGGLSGGMGQNALGAMTALQGQNSPMGQPTMSGLGINTQQPPNQGLQQQQMPFNRGF
jgi:hypothetical protein